MKIGIMAPEESGKTSYLVGLYGTLIHIKNRKLSSEYGLHYEWTNKAQKGLLEHQFDMLQQDDIGRDRFPEKTDDIHRHKVRIKHKEENIYRDIELIDFPGALLRGDTGNSTVVNAETVENTLAECAGFIVLLDARYLLLSETRMAGKTGANDIDRVLEKTIAKRAYGSIGVPVALCISKYDYLPPDQKEAAYGKIKTLFPRFFASNHEHPFFMTGVSLGTDIEEGGEFDPFQLENPLEFCLAMCAFIERDSEQKQANDERDGQYEVEGKIDKIEEEIRRRKSMSISEIVNEQVGNVKKTGRTDAGIISAAGFMGTFRIAERLWPNLTAKSYQEQIDSHREVADRHERRKEKHRSTASESIRIGEEAARRIRDVDNPGIIYYKGKEYHFKRTIGSSFPLEEVIAL
jgi:Double-GTPase 2